MAYQIDDLDEDDLPIQTCISCFDELGLECFEYGSTICNACLWAIDREMER